MPKLTKQTPSFRLHKLSGQAFVELDGKRHYLGPYDAPESKANYDQLVGTWLREPWQGSVTAYFRTFNDEKTLANKLASIIPLVDEVLVIDQGSIDRTLLIAKEYCVSP